MPRPSAGGMGRAALVVSAGILLSRVLGFLRDWVLAVLLGRSVATDLYVAAFTIPDYLFFLMAGGYLSITFVPILSRYLAKGETTEGSRAFTAVFRLVGGAMLVLTVVTMAAAEPLTALLFPRFPPDQVARLVGLVRVVLPAQLFFVLGSLLMAVQYAHRRFLVPTLAPLVYNLGIIAGGLGWAAVAGPAPEGFVWGALAGAVVGNFGLQWWGAARLGVRLVGGVSWRHPALGEYLAMAFPLMVGQSVVALDEQLFRVFGQFAGEEAITALNYARRLNMVPVGVIAQAAGVAAYPFLAQLVAEGRSSEVAGRVSQAVRSGLAVAGLATAVTAALHLPLVRVAFQWGAFDSEDTLAVAPLLLVYAFSIPLWTAHQVYTRGFYAHRRMWTPVVIGTAVTVVALPAYLFAARQLGAVGVAWASTLSVGVYTLGVGVVWHRWSPETATGVLRSLGRVTVAALAAGLAAWGVSRWAGGDGVPGLAAALVALAAGSGVAAGVYVASLALLRAPELEGVLGLWRRRREQVTD